MHIPELSIVLPCLNEALTLPSVLREINAVIASEKMDAEVVVADNGSTDGSTDIATQLGARVVPVTRRGYGNALRGGIAAAKGRFILMGDADGSYDFAHTPRFLERLRAGADLVMGNRFAGGIAPGAMPWKNRYIGNPILSFLGRLFFRIGIHDFHCGLRAFSAEAYRRMDLRTTGMELASEMVIKSQLMGLRLEEVPTTLRPDGRDRPPHLRPWRDGWRHLRFMLLFSPRWLFFYPGLALMLVGSLAALRILWGPVKIGALVFDVHTLLFAVIAALIGQQAVTFAMFSKLFTIRAGLRAPEPRFESWVDRLSVEFGVALGLILALGGLGLSLVSVWIWRQHNFGDLDPTTMLRLVIPGAFGILLGAQIMLTSLFLGVLGLDDRAESP